MRTHKVMEGKNINFGYLSQSSQKQDQNLVLKNLNFSIPNHKMTAILGKNGSGKSTLIKLLSGVHRPQGGHITLKDTPLEALKRKTISQSLSYLPQSPPLVEGMKVIDLVHLGRNPYHRLYFRLSKKEKELIEESLVLTNLVDLRDRYLNELSGGQRQRAYLAMALVQDTPIIMLDEPTTYLDISYQVEFLELLSHMRDQQGKTIVLILHDINLAGLYADQIILIHEQKIWSQGPPESVLTHQNLYDVYGVTAHPLKQFSRPQFIFGSEKFLN